MEYRTLNDLRELFLSFFESKGHLRRESAPLIPDGDDSLLLINSGMAPLKRFFSGEVPPPAPRLTTCQKCIRTPDIERVGKTSRHGTFFEMLGNFSFGDYFKREAIAFAYEFVIDVLKIPMDRLYFSVYLEDDEAAELWEREMGVPKERIVRLGKEDNFWEIGSGPCGPCSEIYYDRGPEFGCGRDDCAPGCDCDRFVEFWNLVFTQFHNDGNGNYTPLEKKNIDTGLGLERLACIMQGVDNLFEVDTIRALIDQVAGIAGKTYKADPATDVSLRVVTDHIRSTVMLISDGVQPSNEGQGYVLRRLLRRAARHGRLLGIERPFLKELSDTVIATSGGAYPTLVAKRAYIQSVVEMEEERFHQTIDQGMRLLSETIERMKKKTIDTLSGEEAFKLYDTYGFPVDLTLEILGENRLFLDRSGFDRLMQEQRDRARDARKSAGDLGWATTALELDGADSTEFIGYDSFVGTAKILAILRDGTRVEEAESGKDAAILLDRTPFYAESGGQVDDTGVLTS
ncbi:alanine--tRNA ligase, partial [Oscillospiraceae bacterium OttesenSCG-928-G22]|nr:alanine--tRNA ligase [Oscillospiraceae bacterium OttesenSCG-928-G22]